MSDDTDRAQSPIEKNLQDAIGRTRSRPAMARTGQCHFCDSDVAAGIRFCDIGCRNDYEKR